MKGRFEIKNNNVYLVRFMLFKTLVGKYSGGMIVFNKPFQKYLEKDNKDSVNILRKTF